MCRRASLPVRRGRGWRQAAPGRQFRLWSRRISRPISPKAHASTTRRSRSAAFEHEHSSYGAGDRRNQRRLLFRQVQFLRRRAANSRRPGRWDRGTPFGERHWALSQRASMGHGPRGLQRQRRCVELLQHDQARSRAYHWGEDGLAGFSDDHQQLGFALAVWNGKGPILKERLFGLTNSEGNHGEDVKEYYYYLDSTPTHSYTKYLYKYPQNAYPYGDLIETSRRRGL